MQIWDPKYWCNKDKNLANQHWALAYKLTVVACYRCSMILWLDRAARLRLQNASLLFPIKLRNKGHCLLYANLLQVSGNLRWKLPSRLPWDKVFKRYALQGGLLLDRSGWSFRSTSRCRAVLGTPPQQQIPRRRGVGISRKHSILGQSMAKESLLRKPESCNRNFVWNNEMCWQE